MDYVHLLTARHFRYELCRGGKIFSSKFGAREVKVCIAPQRSSDLSWIYGLCHELAVPSLLIPLLLVQIVKLMAVCRVGNIWLAVSNQFCSKCVGCLFLRQRSLLLWWSHLYRRLRCRTIIWLPLCHGFLSFLPVSEAEIQHLLLEQKSLLATWKLMKNWKGKILPI